MLIKQVKSSIEVHTLNQDFRVLPTEKLTYHLGSHNYRLGDYAYRLTLKIIDAD